MSNRSSIRLGTRGSALAIRQADLALQLLRTAFPHESFDVETVQTTGDRVQDRPISEFGDKGVFVRAIERALLEGRIDIAVHSLKDVPADLETPGLTLAGFGRREDPRDALVSRFGLALEGLRVGSRVGTSSLRRRVQLLALRPDLAPSDMRGNVDTRLRKLDEGQYDAIILAAAGLHRLGLDNRIAHYLPCERFVPDAGQGIIALQTRAGTEIEEMVRAVSDQESEIAARAERATVRALNADCRSPVGAYAEVSEGAVRVLGMAADRDGSKLVRATEVGSRETAESVGTRLGLRLLHLLEGGRTEGVPAT